MLIFHRFKWPNEAREFADYVRESFELRAGVFTYSAIDSNQELLKAPIVLVERPGEEEDRPPADDDPILGEDQELTGLIKQKAAEYGALCTDREED